MSREAGDADEPSAKRQRASGDPLAKLRTPCLVVDEAVARANAESMLERARTLGVVLRPHVKTHKTLEGGLLATGGTKRRIVASTLAEAQFFAAGGFDDIIYAVPITPDKLDEAADLTARLQAFHVTVDHPVQVNALLARPALSGGKRWSVVLMIDCGYHRDGVDPDDPASVALAKRIATSATAALLGVYTHGGHSYDARSVDEVRRIGEQERDAVVRFANRLRAAEVAFGGVVGVGSTPTCSNPPESLEGVTEMHPGNYVYYDYMQIQLGSCRPGQVACRVCARVIGHYPKQNMLLIDMGWTGISAQGAEEGYGYVDGHPDLRIKKLKQEAGEVEGTDGRPIDFERYPIGSILRVVPWHSCAATHQHTVAHLLGPEGQVVGQWRICKGW